MDLKDMKYNIYKYVLISENNNVFYLRMSPLYLHSEWVLFHRAHYVSPPCVHSSLEWVKQILALERVFYVFHEIHGHHRFLYTLEGEGRGFQ